MRSLTSFEMDQSQSLNSPPYFDGSNYAIWKVRMRAFLCSMDETIWDVVNIGRTRSEAAKSMWIRQPSWCLMKIAKHLTLFFVVYLQMSSTRYLTFLLPRRCGRYWRPHMKEQRKWKTLRCRCWPLSLRSWKWVRMSHLTLSIASWIRWSSASSIWVRKWRTQR